MIIERILARRGFTQCGSEWIRTHGARIDSVKREGTTLIVQTIESQFGLPLSGIERFNEDDIDDFDDYLGEIA